MFLRFVTNTTLFIILIQISFIQLSEVPKVCTGTNFGLSAGRNDYEILRATYSNCVYVDGNLEITNFRPENKYEKLDYDYDFSFLDNIREITGYLLVFNTHLKTLKLKNLQIIRGKTLYSSNYSIFIGSNEKLERLDLTNLTAVQRGSVFIADNSQLCHTNEVSWTDLINNQNKGNYILQNAESSKCPKCKDSCCTKNSNMNEKCGCWFPNGCQKLSRVVCDSKCEDRCYGRGKNECCNKECLGGCDGPSSKDCIACRKFRILETGECVDSCPRIKIIDPITEELTFNPNGMYQFGITCVRNCPKNLFIFQELCVTKCPNETYETEENINNPYTGEKGLRRVCKPCTNDKCPKSCSINNSANLELDNLNSVKDCEILNGNLLIFQQANLTEKDLEVLNNIRIINGYVRIQSDLITSLNFLRNLEIIRAPNLQYAKYSLIVSGKSLRTLNLKKLKSIENGDVYLSAELLCLHNTIDWFSITKRNNSLILKSNTSLQCDNFKCHPACTGCWSTGPDYCQFCKSFKLDDLCIEKCANEYKIHNRYTFIENNDNRLCRYCHNECKNGCRGPTEFDCFSCQNYKIETNSSIQCLNKCPITHYSDPIKKTCMPCASSCYGCRGPEEIINDNGCIDCNSALVDNDDSNTILKCILRTSCPEGFVQDLVKLNNHPLQGRIVCRKCHTECDGCVSSGSILNHNCIKCKNFFSNKTNECVNNCSIHNEYLKIGTNVCLACDQECKSGCIGSSIYECNECKGYKMKLKDVELIINEYIMKVNLKGNGLIERTESLLKSFQKDLDNFEIEKLLVENYLVLVNKSSSGIDRNRVVFCIKQCPKQMPFPTSEKFCSFVENTKNSEKFFMLFSSISAVIFSFLLIAVCGIGLIVKYFDRKNLRLVENEKNFFESKDYDEIISYEDNNEKYNYDNNSMENLILLKNYELEKCYMLGHGAFGTVFVGFYKPNGDEKSKFRVAIKELNAFSTTDDEKIKELENAIINEAAVMASVKHKYCLQLSGLCIAESIKMVTQLIPYGSAVSFLQKYREKINEKNLLVWAQQIAEGMEYLENRKIVHRDLAARNILIKKIDHIKITDFGLAKVLDSNEKEFYAKSNSLLPIKWLAIESIQNRIFNHKSDVWSYGVCLWEIFTFCAKPYAEIETINIINYLKKGVRLSQPQIASIEVYAILLKCWLEKPYSRPSFNELSVEFLRMSQDPKNYLSFKSDQVSNFVTINENSQNLIQNIQNDALDSTLFDEEDKLYKKSNNNSSISPDEGIDLNSFEPPSEQLYRKNNSLSNYNQSLVVFKRNSKIEKKDSLKKNKSFLRRFLSSKSKRINSQMSTRTASTYMSSVYSDESNQVTQQSESLNYEEQQSLLTSSTSQLPTRSNSSNNSSIYNYNSNNKFRDVNNSNSDYLEPIMHNVKQNLEYFGETNQKPVASILVMDKDKKIVTNIANRNPYYNDSLI
ncbi:unnamed protein product [Brachionus calyciflorus]|uniref:receptor protein-tyrosine kinase n=1 Tax=Brachionus calyciflorus TaxID=104777 RepID=A0A813P4M7_9BILA|nr:unnamed protein product [Brachionus calyciflorus]